MKTIHVTRRLAYPQEMVWAALTDSQHIEKWLMPNDFRPKVGHQFQFLTKPAPGFDGIVDCKVLDLEPQSRLAFSWKGGEIDTKVTIFLSPLEAGTEVQLVQEGFKVSNIIPRIILGQGWKTIIGKKLPTAIDGMAVEAV